jgi:hypothetical protein
MSLIELFEEKPLKLFSNKKENISERVILPVPGIEALQTKFGVLKYMEELMDKNSFRFLPMDNFIINSKNRLIATNDFRVIVKDHKGNIPEDVMLNIASVCYLMIGGLIEQEAGYSYIKRRMMEYGVPFLEFKSAGYVSIDLYGNTGDVKYQSRVEALDRNPKM